MSFRVEFEFHAIDAMYTRRFALDFSVLEIKIELLLLGLDQLSRFKCIIDLEQNVLVFGGAGIQVPFLAQERVSATFRGDPPRRPADASVY